MYNKIQEYIMKREEVPECWLLTSYDIVSHTIDKLIDKEIDDEEFLKSPPSVDPVKEVLQS